MFGFFCRPKGSSLQMMVAFVFLILLQGMLWYPLHHSMDIPSWDESNYVGHGAAVAQGLVDLPAMVGSPLYVFVYSIITREFSQINSVFVMCYFLGIGVPLLLFVFLQQKLAHVSLAVLLSVIYSISEHNITHTITPSDGAIILNTILIYRFGVFLFLVSLLFMKKKPLDSLMILFLCTCVRQEYLFILIPYTLYLVVYGWFKRDSVLHHIQQTGWFHRGISAAIMMFCLYIYAVVPDGGTNMERAWFAFSQHYAWQQVNTGLYQVDPMIDYHVIIHHDFPYANSLGSAFCVNPEAMVYHVVKNMMCVPQVLSAFVIPSLMLPQVLIRTVLLSMLFAVVVCLLFCQRTVLRETLHAMIVPHRHLVVLSAISLLSLIPSMFVLAKSSYALATMPFVFWWIGFFYQIVSLGVAQSSVFVKYLHESVAVRLLHWLPYVACCLIFIAILGSAKPFEPHNQSRPLYERVMAVKALLPDTRTTIAGLGVTMYANYLGWDRLQPVEVLFSPMVGTTEKVNIQDIVAQTKPDIIIINQALLSSIQFDAESLVGLNEGWVVYPFFDGKIYLSPSIVENS